MTEYCLDVAALRDQCFFADIVRLAGAHASQHEEVVKKYAVERVFEEVAI